MSRTPSSPNPYDRLVVDDQRATWGPWVLLIGVLGVIVLAVAAVALTSLEDNEATSGGGAAARNATQEVATVTISGADLPVYSGPSGAVADPAGDPAVGRRLPKFAGETFDGEPVVIDPADGRAKVVVFIAHWCSHCQAEVPRIQEYLDAGRLPEGVDVYYVATATNPDQPNYPVSRWIAREGVSVPVLLDDAGSSAGTAAGVGGYPAMVFVAADGTVAARSAGELPVETFNAGVQALAVGR